MKIKTNPIKFTLLTACKNEEEDIRLSIESALAQTYPQKEIIFVDDSTDRTPEIIKGYTDRGVILVNGRRKGCCQARNLGIEAATGDVIVFLTADTKLKEGYLEKILPYYEQGYDMVMTESYSYNLESVYSRFVQTHHLLDANRAGYDPFTTQGYSVRRAAAISVGKISGGEYPVNFCRDWTLAKKMGEKGFKKMVDRSIIVTHKSPDNLKEFWQVQITRGLMSAYQPYFLFHRSPAYLFVKFLTKDILAFFHFILIVPAVAYVLKMTKYSTKSAMDFFPLYWTYLIHVFARCVGEWRGFVLDLSDYRRMAAKQ